MEGIWLFDQVNYSKRTDSIKQRSLSVGRYLGYKQGWGKSLTPDEVKAIHGAGYRYS